MNGLRGWLGRASLILSALALPSAGAAQMIALKTVPVAAGDQFLIFPSYTIGMGGLSIALDDPLLDPFVNPALGSLAGPAQAVVAPTMYTITQNSGGARTLPAGVLLAEADWFGGGVVAVQQLERGTQFGGVWPGWREDVLPPDALRQRSAVNKYAFLTLGRNLPGGAAVGASAFLADLSAVDGVEHLYAMASNIEQSGTLADVRLGVVSDLGAGRRVELVALYHHWDVTHDVTYLDWVLTDSIQWTWERQLRREENIDRTNTLGLHLAYRQPIGETGWRLGGVVTANRKSHPKIPNYEIMNIPRDPGRSWAYDIGVGLAKVVGPTTFGIDVVYEPAWSDTWAEAAEPTPTATGDTIPVGGRTVDNEFSFSNAVVRVGLERAVGSGVFQLGLQMRTYEYDLDQWDYVADSTRREQEEWVEWTPSWGFRWQFSDLELRYLGRVTTGTGRPGVAWDGATVDRAAAFAEANDILLAPSGPLTLQDALVVTHQVSVSIPIR
ncbi:MAG: hypothetical protein PVF27_03280 [Gemmatimonadales bacterium]|jgi:hypothetical protein